MRKVLYVTHNHHTVRPGGVEIYLDELYRAIKGAGAFEPFLIARVDSESDAAQRHAGTRFAVADTDPNLYFIHTRRGEFDTLLWTARDKRLYTEDWRTFLHAIEPDVVHFHHVAWLGHDLLHETRRMLPGIPIVFTLHDFGAICHNGGQMIRTNFQELCTHASPRRCQHCFPLKTVQHFFLRERFIRAALDNVDLFISPSLQLRERYIEWGIDPGRIRYEDNGRIPCVALPDPPRAGRRRRIGFFGQITLSKGVDVLLEAVRVLVQRGVDVQLVLNGSDLDSAPEDLQERIATLLQETSGSVEFAGSYQQNQLPRLMSAIDWVIVPSIWWENAPLVIQEAKMHRRPVICGHIGGMAEKVSDGVDGLHFRVHDLHSLADTIARAVDSPDLWDQLRARIGDPHPMQEHLAAITDIYDELLAGTRPGPSASVAHA
jgi:glycosyltransferase involved in cell wall biosynthesis